MTTKQKRVLWGCFGFIVLIVITVLVFSLGDVLERQILSALNLILIFAYVVTTYYLVTKNEKLVTTNEKLVSAYERSICLQNSPVVTAQIMSQLDLLKIESQRLGRVMTEEEANNLEHINITKLTLHNPSKHNAMDVRVTVTALVNNRSVNSSPPLDGSRDWLIQAGHTVIKIIKIQEDYLSPESTSIQSMIDSTNDANRDRQLVLKIQLSYSDGCGNPIEYPVLSWYFNFTKKCWEYVL